MWPNGPDAAGPVPRVSLSAAAGRIASCRASAPRRPRIADAPGAISVLSSRPSRAARRANRQIDTRSSASAISACSWIGRTSISTFSTVSTSAIRSRRASPWRACCGPIAIGPGRRVLGAGGALEHRAPALRDAAQPREGRELHAGRDLRLLRTAPRLDYPTLWTTPQKIMSGGKWYPQVVDTTLGTGSDKLAGPRRASS